MTHISRVLELIIGFRLFRHMGGTYFSTPIAKLFLSHGLLYPHPRGPKPFHPSASILLNIYKNLRFCADRTLDPSLPLLGLFLLLNFQNLVIGSIQTDQSVIVFIHSKKTIDTAQSRHTLRNAHPCIHLRSYIRM